MNRIRKRVWFWLAAAVLLVGIGCSPEIKTPPVQTCSSTASAVEIVLDLQAIREAVVPLKSSGNCRIRWIGSDQSIHEENPSIDIRFVPPDRSFLRGNILGGETIRMGSNPDEFWLAAPPKEISSYWWGKREQLLTCKARLWLNPAVLLECCGLYDLEGPWMLIRQPGWDVLTRNDESGKPEKRYFVGACDRRVGRIEYLEKGQIVLSIQLQDYPADDKTPCVPSTIIIEGIDPDTQASAILTLQDPALFQPTEAQLKGKLFARPEPRGYEHVYELSDSCEFLKTETQKEAP
jgi:hypothetical protein